MTARGLGSIGRYVLVAARRLASVLADVSSVGGPFDRAPEFCLRVIDVLLRAQLAGTPRHFDDSAEGGRTECHAAWSPQILGMCDATNPARVRT